MKDAEKKPFVTLLLKTASNYRKEITEEFLNICWHSLKEFSLNEIQEALVKHFRNPDCGQYMPHPSEVIRLLQGDSEVQALKAWSKVVDAMRLIGSYESIVFDDYRLHIVIAEMGGWVTLCQKTENDLKFLVHEFHKRYRATLLQSHTSYTNRLIGIREHQNSLHGYCLPKPFIFRDPYLSQATFLQGKDPIQLTKISKIQLSLSNNEAKEIINLSSEKTQISISDKKIFSPLKIQ